MWEDICLIFYYSFSYLILMVLNLWVLTVLLSYTDQIFTLQYITVAKLQLWTVFKGCSIKKAENHCLIWSLQPLYGEKRTNCILFCKWRSLVWKVSNYLVIKIKGLASQSFLEPYPQRGRYVYVSTTFRISYNQNFNPFTS